MFRRFVVSSFRRFVVASLRRRLAGHSSSLQMANTNARRNRTSLP